MNQFGFFPIYRRSNRRHGHPRKICGQFRESSFLRGGSTLPVIRQGTGSEKKRAQCSRYGGRPHQRCKPFRSEFGMKAKHRPLLSLLKCTYNQRAFHACLAMSGQVADKFVFAWPAEHESLAYPLARFCLQAKSERRHNNAVLRFSIAVVEDER